MFSLRQCHACIQVNLSTPGLPQFFSPLVETGPGLFDGSVLDQNTEIALRLLRVEGRNVMITFDETCYFPQYGVLHMGGVKPYYIGGAGSKALIEACGTKPEQLQKLELAQVCLSFLVKRAFGCTKS